MVLFSLLPAVPGLTSAADPCSPPSAVAGGSADSSSRLSFLSEHKQGRLVLLLLAAVATGRLYDRLEMDAPPILHMTAVGLLLKLLEVKSQASGENWAAV